MLVLGEVGNLEYQQISKILSEQIYLDLTQCANNQGKKAKKYFFCTPQDSFNQVELFKNLLTKMFNSIVLREDKFSINSNKIKALK